MRATPCRPNASTFSRITPRAAASCSTNRQNFAPRDSASSPSAPVPAKRSSTRTPSGRPSKRCWRTLNRVSRARSDVGRTERPDGACSRRPRSSPPTIRIVLARFARRPGLAGASGPGRTGLLLLELLRTQRPGAGGAPDIGGTDRRRRVLLLRRAGAALVRCVAGPCGLRSRLLRRGPFFLHRLCRCAFRRSGAAALVLVLVLGRRLAGILVFCRQRGARHRLAD